MNNAIETMRTKDGLLALAKRTKAGNVFPKTYANATQAQKVADKMGAGWAVYGRHPFLVCVVPAE